MKEMLGVAEAKNRKKKERLENKKVLV